MAKTTIKSRPMWWAVTMFVLSVCYLFPETVFNAELVAVAGGLDSTDESLRTVELFGRTISGIGVTLLLADLLIRGRLLESKIRAVIAFCGLAILVWPLVYFGQKWLVDEYIIHPSTAQERQHAYYAQVVRSALIRNAVEIDGVPYDPDRQHSSAEMTFLALFSGMVFADEKLMENIDQYQEAIIKQYVRKSAYQDFEESYSSYMELRGQLRQSYQHYREGSQEYNQSLASIPSRTQKYRTEVEADIKDGWKSYQNGLVSFNKRVESEAQKVAPKIYDYFKRKNNCRSNSCLQRLNNAYDKQIKSLGLGYIPPKYWLITETREIGLFEKAVAGVLTAGVSIVADALDGDNDTITKIYFTNEVAHYQKLLRPKMELRFVKSSGGYPLGIKTMVEFRNHKNTSAKVRASLQKKGLKLPKNWQVSHQSRFKQAVAVKVKAETNAQWKRKMAEESLDMRPNNSWATFQRSAQIQARIKQEAGRANYVNPMLMDWNNRQFKQNVVDPRINRETKRLMRELNAQLPEFADGGALADKAKSALRATVVPPISMALSLFLVIMTALKLPMKGYALWQGKKSAAKTENETENTDGCKRSTLINISVSLLGLLLIISLPLTLFKNRYTEQDSAVHYFLSEINASTSPVIGYALNWVINTQPLVQPTGSALEQALGFVDSFSRNQAVFVLMDERVLESNEKDHTIDNRGTSVTDISGGSASYPLRIRTNVAEAKIRVMNIGPAYRPGLLLKPGRYDIEVSAPGYRTERRWVNMEERKTEFEFALSR